MPNYQHGLSKRFVLHILRCMYFGQAFRHFPQQPILHEFQKLPHQKPLETNLKNMILVKGLQMQQPNHQLE